MSGQLTIKQYIEQPKVKERVEQLLKNRASQFIITLSSMVNSNEKLAACEPTSLFTAALTIVALDLPVNNNLGYAWIIPYKDNSTGLTHAQAQIGYKAFIQLAMRSQEFKTLNVTDVRDGEYQGINRLTGEIRFAWNDDELERAKLKVVGYVAYFQLKNGFEKTLYMSTEEIKTHAMRYSANFKKYNTGLWKDDFDAMAKKTVIKLLLSRFAPLSTDMQKAVEIDQSVLTDDNTKYIDNQKQTAQDISKDKETQRVITHIKNARKLEVLEQCKDACITDELTNLYKEKEEKLLQKQNTQTAEQPQTSTNTTDTSINFSGPVIGQKALF